MNSSRACCASRESEYLHVGPGEIPELAALLIDVSRPGEAHSTYRCRSCGQIWHAYRVHSDQGEDFAVVKVGGAAAPAGPSPELPRSPSVSYAPATTPPPRKARGLFGGFGTLALSILAFYALWGLPGLDQGKVAEYGWLARWVAGAILLVLAIQTIATWIASRKAVRRG
jgi:hypothetical protein